MTEDHWASSSRHRSGRGGAHPGLVVRRVERVQNWKLWTSYALKRE
jgi:hypothetical protein